MPKKLKYAFLVLSTTFFVGSLAAGGADISPYDPSDSNADATVVVPVLVGGLPIGVTVVDGD